MKNIKMISSNDKHNEDTRPFRTRKLFTNHFPLITIFLTVLLLAACSFDYNEFEPSEEDMLPDLVMENVEYIRMKSGEPLARFQANRAERYEKQSIMIVENISFEQFGASVEEVNAEGFAQNATIEIDSNNIKMENSVKIEVESEDVIIETDFLEWQDEPRTLSSGADEAVSISMNNGTGFTGTGFVADARNRTWNFFGGVEGEYYFEDDEEAANEFEEEEEEQEE